MAAFILISLGVGLVGAIALLIYWIIHLPDFLCLNAPIDAEVLVVEGWIPDHAVKGVISEFYQGAYRQIITTGPPLWKGFYLSEYKNFAELTAATLVTLGLPKEAVVAAPTLPTDLYRTYTAAVCLRQWLTSSDVNTKSINLYTLGCHARRSWLIFKTVLAPEIEVGVIAASPEKQLPKRWWKSSVGVRTVLPETIAYFHARFVNWKA
ncbi:MAG: cytosine deaminase [Pseudanabaenales cyanobacterium]|nr:cytosine deaminase [Pseudanabaenales cyanobacterium]